MFVFALSYFRKKSEGLWYIWYLQAKMFGLLGGTFLTSRNPSRSLRELRLKFSHIRLTGSYITLCSHLLIIPSLKRANLSTIQNYTRATSQLEVSTKLIN